MQAGERTRTTSEVRKSDADISDGAERADELRPGDLLADKYELRRRLGVGGMGSVWVAHDRALDIEVALKVIRADVRGVAAGHSADRLLQEARAAAKLGHPAIVRVSDFGATAAGAPFVVMELLEGEDLATALERRGRISASKAVRSLLPIAHALVAAHDKGIVHRDLKPENIFLARADDGSVQPKLIDFGVAKLAKQPSERLTAVGAVMGSPGYMPPEQARGDDVDERADVWSLCVVLYEMLTGRLPFEGQNYHALLRAIIEEEIPPLGDLGVGDEELWGILARGLTKDVEHRWPSMRELGVALADWLILRGVTEDICGTSLVTSWMVEHRGSGELDAFESVPPPPMPASWGGSGPGLFTAPGDRKVASVGGADEPAAARRSTDAGADRQPSEEREPSPTGEQPAARLRVWGIVAAVAAIGLGVLGARALMPGRAAPSPVAASARGATHAALPVEPEPAPPELTTDQPVAAPRTGAAAGSSEAVSSASAPSPEPSASTAAGAHRAARPHRPPPAPTQSASRRSTPAQHPAASTLKRPKF